MKKFTKLIPAFAAAMLTLSTASCKEDVIVGEEPTYDKDQKCYVSVAIYSDAILSRAAEDPRFEQGVEDESKIYDLWFVAYDADGAVVGKPVSPTLQAGNIVSPSPSSDASVGLIAKAVVPIEVVEGSNKITQIICYVNPIQIQELDRPLSVVETAVRKLYGKPVKGGSDEKMAFAMANSVFYPKEDASQLPQIAVPLTDGKEGGYNAVYDTEADALAAIEKDDINGVAQIFVERAASKVRIYREDGFKVEPYVSSATVESAEASIPSFSMSFVPSNWDVNCRGKEGFVLKCYRTSNDIGALGGVNGKYSDVSSVLGANKLENWIWNQGIDKTNPNYGHRSFWACSPAYYSTAYPMVVSDMMSMDDGNKTPTAAAEDYKLEYLYFNDVKNTFPAANGVANAEYNYYLETTVGKTGFNSKNPNACVPSVIVTGSYNLSMNGETLPAGTTFYTYANVGVEKPYVLFDNTPGSINVETGLPAACRSLLDFLGHHKQQTVFFFKGKEAQPLTAEQVGKYLEVKRPTQAVLNLMSVDDDTYKLAARKFTIQLTEAAKTAAESTDGYKLGFVQAGSGYVEITEANFDQANALIAKDAGFADIYSSGKAYFNIPIHHYGWYRAGNKNAASTNGINWTDVQTGDFGIVRNHVYTIGISAIKGLGTGVNDEYPIIPPSDQSKQYIAYKLRVLNWAVVQVQNVEL